MAQAEPDSGLPDDFIEWLSKPIHDNPQPPPLLVNDMLHWRRNPKFAALRAKLFPEKAKQPEELIVLLEDLGMEELIDPIVWAMRGLFTYRDIEMPEQSVQVPVNRILSHAWELPRLRRIFKGCAAGTTPPPVRLEEIRFFSETFYTVSDGNHRAEAAKIRGDEFISAQIEAVASFNPDEWVLIKEGVRNRATGEIRTMEVDTRAAARWLGVKSK